MQRASASSSAASSPVTSACAFPTPLAGARLQLLAGPCSSVLSLACFACTCAVWLLSLVQTCLQSCLLSSATPATFREMYAGHGSSFYAIKHISLVDPAIWQEMLLCVMPASTVLTCSAPGNAQAGHGGCHSHTTSELTQF